jgi:hypothetical protein
MKSDNIRLYITNRYLHGYLIKDEKYTQLIIELYNKIKEKNSNEKLETLLQKDIGEYNAITADIYMSVAAKYLRNRNHRTPTMNDIFNLI